MSSVPHDSSTSTLAAAARLPDTLPGRGRFPMVMMIITGLLLGLIVLAHVFISDIEDLTANGLDVVSVVSLFSIMLLLTGWIGWFLLLSRWKWWQRLLSAGGTVLLPIGFFLIFRPVYGGDANLVRFEPVWRQRPKALAIDVPETAGNVDLQTETADDYPRFLGSSQNAEVSSGLRPDPARFTEAKILWKQPVGQGWSGFAARNGYAVTMEQRGEQECVSCYHIQTGRLEWIYQHPSRHRDRMNLGRIGPRSTPTIHDGRVYALGATGNLVCLNGTDGSLVWQQDLTELLGVQLEEGTDPDGFRFQYEQDSSLAWGRAGSPLVVDELLVVPGGGASGGEKSTLLAFDRMTGTLRWRGGTEMIAYGSPVITTLAGRRQILLAGERKVMGFDPESGNLLWDFGRPGESNGAANTSQVTVVSDDQVLTSKGYPDGGGELLEVSATGDALSVRSVWKNSGVLKTKLTSPVIRDGHAYSFSNGFLECARLSDGQRIWKGRGRFGHGQMVLVDRWLLAHSENGVLYLIEATPDGFREVGSVPTIDGVCWNTLCPYGSMLLVRSELEAACVLLPTADGSDVQL